MTPPKDHTRLKVLLLKVFECRLASKLVYLVLRKELIKFWIMATWTSWAD